jgi:hypothetical protein
VKSFTVHEGPDHPSDRIERGEVLVFIRDGFDWGAALFSPVWMVGAGLWLLVPVYVLSLVVSTAGLAAIGLPAAAIGAIVLALHLLIGFEAGSLRRWHLERRGWKTLGAVQGRTRAECERRFFETWSTTSPRPVDWSRGDIAEANDVLASAQPLTGRSWWPFGRTRGTSP